MFYLNKDDKYRPSSPQVMTAALPKKILHVCQMPSYNTAQKPLRTFDFVHWWWF